VGLYIYYPHTPSWRSAVKHRDNFTLLYYKNVLGGGGVDPVGHYVEVNGLFVSATLPTHWTGGWVGTRDILKAVEKREISCCCRELNLYSSDIQLVE
jgi:hypothetical protein